MRPAVYPIRKGPVVTERAVLWTFVPIARAPHAWFDFHFRVEPAPPCAALEWEWGDGRTVRDSDCSPEEIGPSVYDMWHVYRKPGAYTVTATLVLRGQVIARASADVIVQPGPGQ